jgi:hypothetical protein
LLGEARTELRGGKKKGRKRVQELQERYRYGMVSKVRLGWDVRYL